MTAVVAACVVLTAFGVTAIALRRARRESDRRLEIVFARIDGHLEAISGSVAQAIDRVAEVVNERLQPVPTLDFDELAEALAAAAAARTGAEAVALRIEGPGGRPVEATLGAQVDTDLPEHALAPPNAPSPRAATIDWTYNPSGEPEDELFRSALVAPLGGAAVIPGTLVVYSTVSHAFGPEHARALHELIGSYATALHNARRFADVEARILLDPATGIANRRGYELELGREVARAHKTGRPLSIVLVGIENRTRTATSEARVNGVGEFARLLTRITRRSDISCRRGEHEFAILLPETREAGATRLTARLREEAKRTLGVGPSTFAVGLVEWQPNESIEALEARAEAALARPAEAPQESGAASATSASHAQSSPRISAPAELLQAEPTEILRRDALETLAREIVDAHRFGRSLALLVLDVDGLDAISEQLGREAADEVLGEIARSLDEDVGSGFVHRLGLGGFALVLSGSTIEDAEALLGTLNELIDRSHAGQGVTFTAGITGLAESEDADTALGRAEHALWQARQAGHGTVVVAVPGRRPSHFE